MEPRWYGACALAVVLAGCGPAAPPKVEEPAATDTSVAAKGARELLKEIYGTIRDGSSGNLLALVDPAVLVVGPGPSDLLADRGAALVALAAAVTDGEKHKLSSTDLHVVASPAGHAAWASDLIQLDGKGYVIGVIMTEADELWTVAAVQIAVPVNKKQLAKLLDKGPVPVPAPVPPAIGATDKVLAQVFADAAASPAVLADQVAKSPDAVARDLAGRSQVGRRAIRKTWKKAHKKLATAARVDPVRVQIAPDGTLGWVFGVVDVTDGADPVVPTRMLHVYEKTGDGWELMLTFPAIAAAR